MNSLNIEATRRTPAPSVEMARQLLSHLIAGQLTAGQRLPGERQLAEDLGVGRSTIREMLKSLALLGLVDVRQGDGTYLSATTSDVLPQVVEWSLLLADRSLRSLTEARQHLEIILAGLAAEHRSADDLLALSAVFERMERAANADDHASYAVADADFHLGIANASGNEVLAGVLGSIRSLLRTWTERVTASGVTLPESLELHRPIFDAIGDGDSAAATRAMFVHMEQAIAHLTETLDGAAR
ncbi:FadR/GntR family transcriptional regulator [uncultured Leifsonia sp.]|uniref:FadR/GntR family transcriptional regulator n=1 Tax=uncultured Leifsonia sp. TaxID=340359 RepID=UPI0025CFB8C2|nr:FadR/GntR family transcriptional regulator [uncultured Leifsonia sp.]